MYESNKDPLCECGHDHFDHHGTNGGKCLICQCLLFRWTAPEPIYGTPEVLTEGDLWK